MSRVTTLSVEDSPRSRRVFGESKGEADCFPLPTPRFDWLRGLDLNQRPLGYECERAMTGNPLISRESVLLRAVPRCLLMRRSSPHYGMFRDVTGAKWEQNGRKRAHCCPR